jgi:hypothetical protein
MSSGVKRRTIIMLVAFTIWIASLCWIWVDIMGWRLPYH